jgi:transmembrane sensor
MLERETGQVIDAQAADWAARVDNGPLSAEEQSAFDAWLAGDRRRLGAYAKARAVFAHVQRARALGPDYDAAEFAMPPVAVANQPSRRQLWIGGTATAATLAIAAGVSLQVRSSVFRTKLGEVRLVPLPDGSSMTLNTASRASIDFSDTERRVHLIAGEALFDVARDVKRPFLVEAADTQVRAVGTSFAVRRLRHRPVQVLVREGVVEVKREVTGAGPPVRVTANTRAVAATDGAVDASAITPAEVSRELVWREGLLAFEDMPLERAVAEFARYSDTRIVIEDPAIARETVTGLYMANNPTGFAKAVADALDLQTEATSREVRLYR